VRAESKKITSPPALSVCSATLNKFSRQEYVLNDLIMIFHCILLVYLLQSNNRL